MKRSVSIFLKEWLTNPSRKPLVMRGARQVGKTWLVENCLAPASNYHVGDAQVLESKIDKLRDQTRKHFEAGLRRVAQGLRDGQVVGILPDQEPLKDHGVFAPFFGVPQADALGRLVGFRHPELALIVDGQARGLEAGGLQFSQDLAGLSI